METVIENGAGVCQDFAHILIAVLRAWGWAARYASGYVYTGDRSGGRITADAMHAWVQAYRPDFGWVGLDPTTGGYADDSYIPVAFGRDYDDVRPVRGVLSGALATQSQEALLAVTLLGGQQ
jgi:transglutaminase-like putative cysteine protease